MHLPKWIKARKIRNKAAKNLYAEVLATARNPYFYDGYGVEDSMEGRFELIAALGGLIVSRLSQPEMGRQGKALAQKYFDVMFRNIDWALRETGIGDLGVPRRVKKMMTAFKGRSLAYCEALSSCSGEVKHVLFRNMYAKGAQPSPEQIEEMALYIKLCAQVIENAQYQDFLGEKIHFPTPKKLNSNNTKEEYYDDKKAA